MENFQYLSVMNMVKCPKCDDFNGWTDTGNGECSTCHGKGYYIDAFSRFTSGLVNGEPMNVDCEVCNRSGVCQTCQGSGRVPFTPLFNLDINFSDSDQNNEDSNTEYISDYDPDRYSSTGYSSLKDSSENEWIIWIIILAVVGCVGIFLFKAVKSWNPHLKTNRSQPAEYQQREYIRSPSEYELSDPRPGSGQNTRDVEQSAPQNVQETTKEVPTLIPQRDHPQTGIPQRDHPRRTATKINLESGVYHTNDNCNEYVILSLSDEYLGLQGIDKPDYTQILYFEDYFCTSRDEPNTYFLSNSNSFMMVRSQKEVMFQSSARTCVFKKVEY